MDTRCCLWLLLMATAAAQTVSPNLRPEHEAYPKGSFAQLEVKARTSKRVNLGPEQATLVTSQARQELTDALEQREQLIVMASDPDTTEIAREEVASIRRQLAFRNGLDPRIINGFPGNLAEFPYQVSLGFATISSPRVAHFCGGVLISPNWVLTAAHCVARTLHTPQLSPSDVMVFVGSAQLSRGGRRIGVKYIEAHPSYDYTTSDNDVAVLQLASPVPAQVPIQMLTAQEDARLLRPGQNTVVSGWGDTVAGANASSDQLLFALIPVVDFASCNGPNSYNGALTTNMICAGVGNGDACQGDSGGPMAVPMPDGQRRKLAGVVSGGKGCNLPKYPGVYTRVANYEQWVRAVEQAH